MDADVCENIVQCQCRSLGALKGHMQPLWENAQTDRENWHVASSL